MSFLEIISSLYPKPIPAKITLENIDKRLALYQDWLHYKYTQPVTITSTFLDTEQLMYVYDKLGFMFFNDNMLPKNNMTFNEWLSDLGYSQLIF